MIGARFFKNQSVCMYVCMSCICVYVSYGTPLNKYCNTSLLIKQSIPNIQYFVHKLLQHICCQSPNDCLASGENRGGPFTNDPLFLVVQFVKRHSKPCADLETACTSKNT